MKNVLQIDNKTFKITDTDSGAEQIFAATKKAAANADGTVIIITDIYKASEGIINILLNSLQINGVAPSDINDAVILLNDFVGS
ncbi:MAG: hypothetical protein LBB53_00095, partial [Prevotellaceae bacterium]|nr:hypothetical protein [Prevotellaceae bacterium]